MYNKSTSYSADCFSVLGACTRGLGLKLQPAAPQIVQTAKPQRLLGLDRDMEIPSWDRALGELSQLHADEVFQLDIGESAKATSLLLEMETPGSIPWSQPVSTILGPLFISRAFLILL